MSAARFSLTGLPDMARGYVENLLTQPQHRRPWKTRQPRARCSSLKRGLSGQSPPQPHQPRLQHQLLGRQRPRHILYEPRISEAGRYRHRQRLRPLELHRQRIVQGDEQRYRAQFDQLYLSKVCRRPQQNNVMARASLIPPTTRQYYETAVHTAPGENTASFRTRLSMRCITSRNTTPSTAPTLWRSSTGEPIKGTSTSAREFSFRLDNTKTISLNAPTGCRNHALPRVGAAPDKTTSMKS